MNRDQELIRDFDGGNEKAFDSLVHIHLAPVYNFVLRLIGNDQDAEDVTQTAFVSAWVKLGTFRRGENFKTWLFSIARNAAIDLMRKKKDLPMAFFQDEQSESFESLVPDTDPFPDEIAALAEEKQSLNILLQALPLAQREVLLLHFLEHLTFAQISAVLGESIDTVKSRNFRGLHALRQLVRDAPNKRAGT